MKLHPAILAVFFVLISILSPLKALAGDPVEITIDGNPPWNISADRVTAYAEKNLFLAEGSVRLKREGEMITGDRARYHSESKTAEIIGNVVLVSKDFKVVCRRLVINVEQNIGKIYGGTAYFPENHYYISGDEIEKTGPDTFLLIQGRATSCDGPNPSWTLTGHNITVRKEGYATAEHVTFSTSIAPILYLPWLKIPVKSQRQSGLLMPGIRDSSRDGFTVTQPVYWAVSDSKDMTLYLTYMAKRGLEATVEARYNTAAGKGTYRVSYLQDRQAPSIYYSRPDREDKAEERFWIVGMSDMKTKGGFNVKLDLDYASDPEYLNEFKDTFTGFDATSAQFLQEFGREPAEPLDPLRKSTLQISKTVNKQNFNLTLEYTQNLNDPDNLETIQRLPVMSLDLNRQMIGKTPLYFSMNSEYTYFSRKTNDESLLNEQGHRLDILAGFYLPVKLFGVIDLEPSLALRETMYYPHGMNEDPTDPDFNDRNYRFYSREMYEFGLETSTNIYRVYDIGLGGIDKVKHRIKPELTYSYVPDRYQGRLPYWDSVDRIGEKDKLRYGVVNYLIAKMEKNRPHAKPATANPPASDDEKQNSDSGEQAGSNTSAQGEPEYEYREFLKFGIYRSYDFVEAQRALNERASGLPEDFNRPHSPWEIELELNLRPYFWARAQSEFDTYADQFLKHDIVVKAWDRRGDYIALEYELNMEPYRLVDRELYEYEEIRAYLNVKIDEEWAFQYKKQYSIKDSRDIETLYSLSYKPQCWGIRVEYSDKPDDKTVTIMFSLLGLGEIGSFSQ